MREDEAMVICYCNFDNSCSIVSSKLLLGCFKMSKVMVIAKSFVVSRFSTVFQNMKAFGVLIYLRVCFSGSIS